MTDAGVFISAEVEWNHVSPFYFSLASLWVMLLLPPRRQPRGALVLMYWPNGAAFLQRAELYVAIGASRFLRLFLGEWLHHFIGRMALPSYNVLICMLQIEGNLQCSFRALIDPVRFAPLKVL